MQLRYRSVRKKSQDFSKTSGVYLLSHDFSSTAKWCYKYPWLFQVFSKTLKKQERKQILEEGNKCCSGFTLIGCIETRATDRKQKQTRSRWCSTLSLGAGNISEQTSLYWHDLSQLLSEDSKPDFVPLYDFSSCCRTPRWSSCTSPLCWGWGRRRRQPPGCHSLGAPSCSGPEGQIRRRRKNKPKKRLVCKVRIEMSSTSSSTWLSSLC